MRTVIVVAIAIAVIGACGHKAPLQPPAPAAPPATKSGEPAKKE